MQESQSFVPSSSSLTEDEVKQRFVPFLRDFYKNRYEPMPNSVSVELDNVSAEGWVADGKISFRKADGSPFICTYEATSRDKAEEVKFQLNLNYFVWDCFAFGAACAAVVYVFFYEARFVWLVELKTVGNIGLLLGMGLIGFFAWYFVMQGWRKYRYIYAIQQFKQYRADEQWVALAKDVFPAQSSDPFFIELRNQCVYNGIGLALVPLEGNVEKILDPSRLGIYGEDRKMAHWVTRAQWYQAFSQNVGTRMQNRPKAPDALTALWNKMYRPFHYLVIDPFQKYIWRSLSKPFDQTSTAYTRFMSAQRIQKWVVFLTLAVTVPLFWNVTTFREEKVNELKELQLRTKNGQNPEDLYGPQVDQEIIPLDGKPTGVPKQFPIRKGQEVEDEGNTIVLSGGDETEDNATEKPKPKPKPKPVAKPATKPAPKPANQAASSSDPCNLLRTRHGWFVQDDAFGSNDLAAKRVEELRKKDITCQWAAQSCVADGRTGWLVWLGNIYPTEAAAQTAADDYIKAFQRYGLKKGKFLVRKLR